MESPPRQRPMPRHSQWPLITPDQYRRIREDLRDQNDAVARLRQYIRMGEQGGFAVIGGVNLNNPGILNVYRSIMRRLEHTRRQLRRFLGYYYAAFMDYTLPAYRRPLLHRQWGEWSNLLLTATPQKRDRSPDHKPRARFPRGAEGLN